MANRATVAAIVAAALAAAAPPAAPALGRAEADARAASSATFAVRPGPGVSSVSSLSAYEPSLRGTPGDSALYFLDSGKPGGVLLVVGGTHPDEPAGIEAAVAIIGRAQCLEGRIIVLPLANGLALASRSGGGSRAKGGATALGRAGLAGARRSSAANQGAPDPAYYLPPGTAEPADAASAEAARLPGHESRNLNRAYPGDPDGSPTERVAFAVMELLRQEKIDLAMDLHEAPSGSALAMTVVAHQRALWLAASVALDLAELGARMGLEQSPESARGYSHREWGDRSGALALLVETPDPDLDGSGYGEPYLGEREEWPLWKRTLIQLAAVRAAAARFSEAAGPGRAIRAVWLDEPDSGPAWR